MGGETNSPIRSDRLRIVSPTFLSGLRGGNSNRRKPLFKFAFLIGSKVQFF